MLVIVLLWFGIAAPLTLLGAILGKRHGVGAFLGSSHEYSPYKEDV